MRNQLVQDWQGGRSGLRNDLFTHDLSHTGLWAFAAMLVCSLTLVITVYISGTYSGEPMDRCWAWVRRRPRPKTDKRLGLEAQWFVGKPTLEVQLTHSAPILDPRVISMGQTL